MVSNVSLLNVGAMESFLGPISLVAILIHWAKTMHTNDFRIHKLSFTFDYLVVKFVVETKMLCSVWNQNKTSLHTSSKISAATDDAQHSYLMIE